MNSEEYDIQKAYDFIDEVRRKKHLTQMSGVNSTYRLKQKTLGMYEGLRYNLRITKSRCKTKGMEFSITVDDLKIPEVCPLIGIKLSFGLNRDNTPSIDRIDNSRGYVPGNVRVVSHKANRWKNDMSYQDVKLLLDNWYKV